MKTVQIQQNKHPLSSNWFFSLGTNSFLFAFCEWHHNGLIDWYDPYFSVNKNTSNERMLAFGRLGAILNSTQSLKGRHISIWQWNLQLIELHHNEWNAWQGIKFGFIFLLRKNNKDVSLRNFRLDLWIWLRRKFESFLHPLRHHEVWNTQSFHFIACCPEFFHYNNIYLRHFFALRKFQFGICHFQLKIIRRISSFFGKLIKIGLEQKTNFDNNKIVETTQEFHFRMKVSSCLMPIA